jgi:uncharacterized protein (TIGR03437 family)
MLLVGELVTIGAYQMLSRLLICVAAMLPSFAACSFMLSPTGANVSYLNGDGTIAITASASNCARTASSNSSWITITLGQSGMGDGVVGYTVSQNSSNSPRSGSLTAAGIVFNITQAGAPCTYSLSPNNASVPATGGSGTFNVITGCSWTANSNADWISTTDSGTGNGTVQYTAAPNTGNARSGTIGVGNQNFTISQAVACNFTMNPTGITADPSGATGSFTLTASAQSCPWTATSNNPDFVSITSAASGTGNATIGYTIASNLNGPARSSFITAGNAFFSIFQPAGQGCFYTISSGSASFPAFGGTGSFNVTSNCPYTPTTFADWITVFPPPGNSTAVSFIVGVNTSSSARTGVISVGAANFTVQQSGVPCSVTVSPTTLTIVAGGGSGSILVTALDGCNWSATSNANWMTLQPASGSGEGTVAYTAAANTTSQQRNANITIANQTIRVTQDATDCGGAVLTPDHATIPAAGGPFSFHLTTACVYSATSNNGWIAIVNGNGTGSGDIGYSVGQNTSINQRQGSIGVAGLRFAVSQDGASSGVSIDPSSAAFGAKGGTGVISVTCPTGCSWTPTADQGWITFTYAAANGNGRINYMVPASNSTDARSGNIFVSGQTFQITQSGMPALHVSAAGVVNAASFVSGPLAPGELITIFGDGIGPTPPAGAQLTADGLSIANRISETRVLFDGIAAPMLYASGGQVSAIVPYGVAGKSSTQMQMEYQGFQSAALKLDVAQASPAIFTLDGSGTGQGAILNQNGSVNGPSAPAARGSVIVLYATGGGQTNPAGVDGRLGSAPLPRQVAAITVQIGGIDAAVSYAGAAPTFPAGVMQINARVPPTVASGAQSILVKAGNAVSPAGVTVAIQ